MPRFSQKFIGDLGQAMYEVSVLHKTDVATMLGCINAVATVLDKHGADFRLFLQAAGADDDEQAKGRMG